MTINLLKGMGKAYKTYLRNKASKKLFNNPSYKPKLQHPVIKSVEPAKNLTERRKVQQEIFKSIDDQYTKRGVKPGPETKASEIKVSAAKKSSKIHDKYEKDVKASKKAKSTQTKKAVGAAVGTGAAVVGAHVGAKRKWPKYKKFAESDIKTVDGKLKLVPKKKETELPEGFVKIKD